MTDCTETELIYWIDAKKEKPDAAITVLICSPESGDSVWLGFFDDEDGQWRDINNVKIEHVTRWAEMPSGPEDR